MSKPCAICISPDCPEIDRKLAANKHSKAGIAREHKFSEDCVRNHAQNHLPRSLAKAQKAEEVAKADTLLEQVRSLGTAAKGIYDTAVKAGDQRTALLAIRELRPTYELLGRISGELSSTPAVVVNMGAQPPAAAEQPENFEDWAAEDIAHAIATGLSPDKAFEVLTLLQAQLAITTTGEPVDQLA